MSENKPCDMLEYVIIVYARGTVTTIIGFADFDTAVRALTDSAQLHSADWGYLYRADGELLASFPWH